MSDTGIQSLDAIGECYEVIKRYEDVPLLATSRNDPQGNGPCRRTFWETEGSTLTTLIASIEAGAAVVSYHGHGNLDRWSNIGCNESLSSRVVEGLNIQEGSPLVLSIACNTGQVEQDQSFAETWQSGNKCV